VNGVYMDHAATSFPKAPGVAESMVRCLQSAAGNPGRGGHRLSVAALRVVEGARQSVADLLGGDPDRTLLGPGATYWLNVVLRGRLRRGDCVVTSALEHNAVMRPLRELEARRGVRVVVVPGAREDGVPTVDEVAQACRRNRADLVVLTHASNVTGAVLPVEEAARAVAPVPTVVDAAQTAGALAIDFDGSGVAALVCSGHKGLLGPPGIGVLMLAEGFEVEEMVRGGTGSRSESEQMPTWLPDRLEAGTPNVVGAAGLAAACAWWREQAPPALHRHTAARGALLAERLQEIPGVDCPGLREDQERVPVLSVTVRGLDNGELATWLDRERGIMVRAGLHCAPAAHRRLGTYPDGTLRVAIGPFIVDEDVEALLAAIRDARRELA
jgi:cysteine desulfurase family protein